MMDVRPEAFDVFSDEEVFDEARRREQILIKEIAARGRGLPVQQRLAPVVEPEPYFNGAAVKPVQHPAVCEDCGEATMLPFKPRSNAPVYCKSCYYKRCNK